MKYWCTCEKELQHHNTVLIKEHMDSVFKELCCKECDSENFDIIKKSSLVIGVNCRDCGKDSFWYWFGTVM